MHINFFFRKPLPQFHSIENLFASIQKNLPTSVSFSNIYMPFHNSFSGRLKNILFARKNIADINHITGDINYLALGLPPEKTIITVHDIGSILNQKNIKKLIIKKLWLDIPLRRVKHITVISEFSKNELIETLKINPDKISVIPNCINDDFFNISPAPKKNNILFIGTKPNKNLENSLLALNGTGYQLHIVGQLTDNQRKTITDLNIKVQNYVNISHQQLLQLYSQAEMLLFPSFYEGFGLPVIEAQAARLPVITSDLPPMNQIAGNGALKVNPHKPDEIRKAIDYISKNPKLKQNLIRNGLKNAQNYSCQIIANQYVKVYEKI